MKIDMVMPQMGESIAEGKVLKWHKKVGDKVQKDETVLEISTDKVDSEIPSPAAGIIAELVVAEGETVAVGTLIARIETDASVSANQAPTPKVQPAQATSPTPKTATASTTSSTGASASIDMVMPQMGESIAEGKVLKWHKKVGDKVQKDETVLEISTDKVDSEIPSPASGVITEILVPEGEVVAVGTLIARIGSASGAVAESAVTPASPKKEEAMHFTGSIEDYQKKSSVTAAASPRPAQVPAKMEGGSRFYSPLVRSIAQKEGLSMAELEAIPGTGLNGRVSKNDILGYLSHRQKGIRAPSQSSAAMPVKQVADVKFGYQKERVELIEMNNIRKLTAEYMRRSLDTSAHVYTMTEVDMSRIVKFREKHKSAFEKREGIKLTYTPFIIDAMIKAVKDLPMINVSVDGTTIVKKNYINLGMAVSIENNTALIVPVIKDADTLNLTGLCRASNDLAVRARSKKLKPDEIQDGTITLTNMGVFGSTAGFPIINQPQVAIMGVGAIKKRPVVIQDEDGEDTIAIRSIMFASLSYDHRVVDGALGGSFLQRVAFHLENFDITTAL
ncbi:MAG: 2-oxoglutarate dehydrogenase, E2 component, dihydrolipoamide succinyltransferase [Bacteroidetes bacterium]|nr:2-oxoglutarate dehydrogenase, E2 component, dihydrolipoamide succinyltransferase [Bacteroidota bacterium]